MKRAKQNGIFIFVLVLVGLLTVILSHPVLAEEGVSRISIRVDGLSCPFCAYGLEKKLSRLAGAEVVRIDIEKGIAVIKIAEGKTILETDLKKAVSDAGFTAREITYVP